METSALTLIVSGSSRGRGTRAAGWFADLLAAKKDTSIESLILEEGITGWASAGDDFVMQMYEHDASKWTPAEKKPVATTSASGR